MQRWFFADEREVCIEQPTPELPVSPPPSPKPPVSDEFSRYWTFCVRTTERLWPNEYLAITGDCEALGDWTFERCLLLQRRPGQSDVWEAYDVNIPRYRATEYRYLVLAIDETAQQQIMRRWETAKQPRLVPAQEVSATHAQPPSCDVFGQAEDGEALRVDRGWLTTETVVQFKFYWSPFCLQPPLADRQLYVRVTPLRRTDDPCKRDNYASLTDELNAGRAEPGQLSTAFAFSEAALLQPGQTELRPQPKFGIACGRRDLLLVHCTVGDFERTVFHIDLYTYSAKAASDEPAYHFGYQDVPASLFGERERARANGSFELPVLCATKHRPLGVMRVGFLLVRPADPPLSLPLRASYTRHWLPKYVGLEVGHRGCGPTFFTYEHGVVRENSLHSLQLAAASGADMLEMDVQLTSDLVPVLVHDFHIHVTRRRPAEPLRRSDFAKRLLCDCTLAQLQRLRTTPYGEGYYHWPDDNDNDADAADAVAPCPPPGETAAQQPFARLADALQSIDPYVGFNLEIKWPQLLHEQCQLEDKLCARTDKNRHIDAILQVVFELAGARRIVFSSFDTDSCTMLRYKQNRYPVLLLLDGQLYEEPRCRSLDAAVCNALTNELLGLVTRANDLLQLPNRVTLARANDLVMFCYGEELNSQQKIGELRELGVHACIYDRIDQLIGKAAGRSVFYLQSAATQEEQGCQRYQSKGCDGAKP